MTTCGHTFQYIPFIDNLEWMLQNRDLYKEVILIAGLYARKLKAISQTLALLIIVQSDVAMHKLIDPSWENLLYRTVVIVIVFA